MRLMFARISALFAVTLGALAFSKTSLLCAPLDVDMRVQGETKYDDNIFYAKNDITGDLITALSPSLRIGLVKGTFQLKADAKINFLTYVDNTKENDITKEATANIFYALSERITINTVINFKDDFDPNRFIDIGGITGKNDYKKNTIINELRHTMAEGFSYILRHSNEILQFDKGELNDSFENRLTLQPRRNLPSLSMDIYAKYEYTRRDFKSASHAELHTIGLGIIKEIASRTFLETAAGFQTGRNYSHQEFEDITGYLSLRLQPAKLTTCLLSYEVKNEVNGYAQDTFFLTMARCNIIQELTRNSNIEFDASISKADFNASIREDALRRADIYLTHNFSDSLYGKIGYSHQIRNSNQNIGEYGKNIYSISFTKKF